MAETSHITLSAAQAGAMRAAAREAYPHECCGLLIGEGEACVTITEVVATANVADNPRRAFAIDPQAQFDLLRATRAGNRRVVGHFHSHPDGSAQPSAHDLAMAHDPEALWLVLAASADDASAPRAFRPDGGGFVEVPLSIQGIAP
jgi:proteasome lid subunit RPN8/RPN11